MITSKEKAQLRPYEGGRLKGRYFTVPRYALAWGLSPITVLAYGVLLDRTTLSARNGWKDREGRYFVHYSLTALSRDLGISETSCRRALAELEENGLLRRVLNRGKATRLYLLALSDAPSKPVDAAWERKEEPPDTGDLDALWASYQAYREANRAGEP